MRRGACLVSTWLVLLLSAPAPGACAGTPALPPARVRAWQTGLLQPDRVQHASLSLTLGLAAGLLSRKPAVAFSTGLGLGLVKEIRDRRHSGFDRADLMADAIGAGLAALVTHALE